MNQRDGGGAPVPRWLGDGGTRRWSPASAESALRGGSGAGRVTRQRRVAPAKPCSRARPCSRLAKGLLLMFERGARSARQGEVNASRRCDAATLKPSGTPALLSGRRALMATASLRWRSCRSRKAGLPRRRRVRLRGGRTMRAAPVDARLDREGPTPTSQARNLGACFLRARCRARARAAAMSDT